MSSYINGHLNIMAYEAATLAYRHCEGWLDELLDLLETNRKTAVEFFASHFPEGDCISAGRNILVMGGSAGLFRGSKRTGRIHDKESVVVLGRRVFVR